MVGIGHFYFKIDKQINGQDYDQIFINKLYTFSCLHVSSDDDWCLFDSRVFMLLTHNVLCEKEIYVYITGMASFFCWLHIYIEKI
jgi:hypothetical protein